MNGMPDPRAGAQGPGFPPPHYGPQGYAAPPAWAGLPPGPPPQRKRSRRTAVVLVVAAVLVAAAGGVWFLTRGEKSGEPDTPAAQDYNAAVEAVGAAEVAWRVDQGESPKAIAVDDHWVTGKHLVRRLPGRAVAYDLQTGKTAWEFALDGPEDRCRSSQEQSKNRVALLRNTDASGTNKCGKLTVLDIGTGKEVLTTELPAINGKVPGNSSVPVVFGERVVIPSVYVHDITSGAALPSPLTGNGCGVRKAGLFGDLLLADSVCDGGARGEKDDRTKLRAFDADLKTVWEWEPPKGKDGKPLQVHGVVSVDPLVVELGAGGDTRQLMRADPASGKTVPISEYDGGKIRGHYMDACEGYALGNCELARVTGNKVILMTTPEQINPDTPAASPGMKNTEFRNELVAFDLDTGKQAWRTGKQAGRALSLVPSDSTKMIAYQPANPNGSKGIVFSVDPATGKLAPLMPIGPKAHGDADLKTQIRAFRFGGDNHQAVWQDGLFLIFSTTHRTASRGDVETVAFALPK